MFERFQRIGAAVNPKNQSFADKIQSYLEKPTAQTLVYSKKDKKYKKFNVHPIVFDFNFENKSVSISKGPAFEEGKNYYISSAPGNKNKVYLNTVKASYLFFDDTLRGFDRFFKNIPTNKFVHLREYIQQLKEFYKNDRINEQYLENPDVAKTEKKKFDTELKRYYGLPAANGYDIYGALTYFNGKPLDNYPDFFREYLEMIYWEKVGKNFAKQNTMADKVCYICANRSEVTGEIDFPSKFYITDKPGFFENMNSKKAYKSLSICHNCYENILRGIIWSEQNLNFKYNRMDFYVIPNSKEYTAKIKDNVKAIQRIVDGLFRESISDNDLRKILEKLKDQKKYMGATFDFLFYKKSNSAFKVYRHYADISQLRLTKLLQDIKEVRKKKPLPYWGAFSLSTLKDIFYSHSSHGWGKHYLVLIRNLFEIMDSIIYGNEVNRRYFLSLVMRNIKKEYLEGNQLTARVGDKLGKTLSFIQLFRMNDIWGEDMEKDFGTTGNEELDKFLKKNNINGFRSVLVAFGYLINKIVWAQRDKSKTFMGKVKFDGMKKKDLISLHNELLDYFELYSRKIFRENSIELFVEKGIHSYGGELSAEEIPFYILVGINAGKMIGLSHGKTKEETIEKDV